MPQIKKSIDVSLFWFDKYLTIFSDFSNKTHFKLSLLIKLGVAKTTVTPIKLEL